MLPEWNHLLNIDSKIFYVVSELAIERHPVNICAQAYAI
jgi:hypothetical protein